MQTDLPTSAHPRQEPAAGTAGLDVLVADIARQMGCADFPPAPDGHCELVLDGNRSLSLWPRPDASGVLLSADLPLPEGVDLEAAYRAALGYCLGAASVDGPVIGRSEDGTLVLMWSMAAEGGPDHAADGTSLFLENLTLAETVLAGKPVEEEAANPTPAGDEGAAPSKAVLEAMEEALGLETIEFDEDGFGTFQTNDGSLVLLQHSAQRGRIAVLAQVSTLSEGEEELCREALDYNYAAAGAGEPVLGLDTHRGGLFLITTLGTQDSAASEVEVALELFMDRFAKCRGTVHDPDFEDALEEAEAGEEQEQEETFAAGIRV